MTASESRFCLTQLSELSGVSPRNIRFYIQLGLVGRPVGERCSAYYNDRHLERLLRIKHLTQEGLSLEVVRSFSWRHEDDHDRQRRHERCRARTTPPQRCACRHSEVRALSFAFSFVHFLTRGVGKKRARFHCKKRNRLTKCLTWSFAAALTASALSTTEPAQAKPEGCPESLC